MKSKEEIEQLAFLEYPRVINDPYNPMEDDNADERQIWINAYSKCQEDMTDKRYTLDDMKKACACGIDIVCKEGPNDFQLFEDLINSLNDGQD